MPETARDEVRRIVVVSRAIGVLVAVALAAAGIVVHHDNLASPDAIFLYVTVFTGLVAYVTISTAARVGHARVLERTLHEVHDLSEQLRELAERDPLTGLYNLRAFHTLLEHELSKARDRGEKLTLVVADLDNFKVLNDAFGHQMGDTVLCEAARIFRERPNATAAARLGGDEFAMLLPGIDPAAAWEIVECLTDELHQLPSTRSIPEAFGSFGVATFPDDGTDTQALFVAADGRMYSEKHRRKAESLASIAGAARKMFVRAGRAMRPNTTTSQILQEIADAAREEFSLSVCSIRIPPSGHHPEIAVFAMTPEVEAACMDAGVGESTELDDLPARLTRETWVIESPLPDETSEGTLLLAGVPNESFRPDASVVRALADLVQAAVANGRAHVDAVRAGRERDIHIELAHVLAGGGDLRMRLLTVAEKIAEFVGVPSVAIEGLAPKFAGRTYNVASGTSNRFMERWEQTARLSPEGQDFVRFVGALGPCILEDVVNDERIPEAEREILQRANVRSSAVCPIRFDKQLLGVLAAVSMEDDWFDEETLTLLTTIADHLAPAISVALLRDELEASYAQLELESRESLTRLADAAEARDPHTGGHLRRIRHYSIALALELGMSESDAQAIGAASAVHDLGKLRLPDAILLKPGGLDPDDWDLMREHPLHGERLIGASPKFALERAVARWHHERWDGSGYPDGLRGEDIPLPARVVAVADAFDALTTQRPYKHAWPLHEAVAEVRRMSGRMFCPTVVDALESLWRSGRLAAIYANGASEDAVHALAA